MANDENELKQVDEAMLTTIDNPYDPFDQFDEWYSYDEFMSRKENRPTCCAYLARVAMNSDDVSDNEFNRWMNETIDEILELNLSGKFKKVTRPAKPVTVSQTA